MQQPTILFEDSHLLVVEKPAGMPSQMTPDGKMGAEDILRTMIETRDKKPGRAYLHTVHRLDGAVSGILLLAKSSKALSRLSEAIREHRMKKQYIALVEGTPPWKENEILVDTIAHGSHRAIKSTIAQGGKKASLKIVSVSSLPNNTSQVLVELLSGRYHQIRFQLSSRGHPILGDTLYHSTRNYHKGKIALHHTLLMLEHPTLKQEMVFTSNPTWTNTQRERKTSLGDHMYEPSPQDSEAPSPLKQRDEPRSHTAHPRHSP